MSSVFPTLAGGNQKESLDLARRQYGALSSLVWVTAYLCFTIPVGSFV
ncbi:hypothetical protein [Flavilitoribacter nigricans]|nr:hypothetical protein [Flavilitoribacter nigricans]